MSNSLRSALEPFAAYGEYMNEKEPGWYDRGLYYGVKHPGAPQIKRSDFKYASNVLRRTKMNKRELTKEIERGLRERGHRDVDAFDLARKVVDILGDIDAG